MAGVAHEVQVELGLLLLDRVQVSEGSRLAEPAHRGLQELVRPRHRLLLLGRGAPAVLLPVPPQGLQEVAVELEGLGRAGRAGTGARPRAPPRTGEPPSPAGRRARPPACPAAGPTPCVRPGDGPSSPRPGRSGGPRTGACRCPASAWAPAAVRPSCPPPGSACALSRVASASSITASKRTVSPAPFRKVAPGASAWPSASSAHAPSGD